MMNGRASLNTRGIRSCWQLQNMFQLPEILKIYQSLSGQIGIISFLISNFKFGKLNLAN